MNDRSEGDFQGPSGATVVWGVVLLAVAGFVVASAVFRVSVSPVLAFAGLLIGAGLLLVLFAAIGGRRNSS